eukprot:4295701-Alexandrium_andersonii.AAC.1
MPSVGAPSSAGPRPRRRSTTRTAVASPGATRTSVASGAPPAGASGGAQTGARPSRKRCATTTTGATARMARA